MKEAEDIEHTSMTRMPWPPHPDELCADYVQLPESLLLFLNVLFQRIRGNVNPKFQWLVQSAWHVSMQLVVVQSYLQNTFCCHEV